MAVVNEGYVQNYEPWTAFFVAALERRLGEGSFAALRTPARARPERRRDGVLGG
jgi:hypothetical protein